MHNHEQQRIKTFRRPSEASDENPISLCFPFHFLDPSMTLLSFHLPHRLLSIAALTGLVGGFEVGQDGFEQVGVVS